MKKILVALVVLCFSAWTQAQTRYDFSFTTEAGSTSDAYVLWNGSRVTGGGGSLVDFPSGSMNTFAGSSLDLFTFKINTTTYTADFIKHQLSWTNSMGPNALAFTGSVSPLGAVYEAPQQVPEIGGKHLPQALLILGGLFLAFHSRKHLKSTEKNSVRLV